MMEFKVIHVCVVMLLCLSSVYCRKPGMAVHVSIASDCQFKLSNASARRLQELTQELREKKVNVIHITFQIMNKGLKEALGRSNLRRLQQRLEWTILRKEFILNNDQVDSGAIVFKTPESRSENYMAEIIVPESCITYYNATYSMLDYLNSLVADTSSGMFGILNEVTGSIPNTNKRDIVTKKSGEIIYKQNCKTCTIHIRNTILANFAYGWAYLIVVFSPLFAYVLYDAFHISQDNFKYYKEKEKPYSLKRFTLWISFQITRPLCLRRYQTDRPVIRTLLLIWILNMAIFVTNVLLKYYSQGNSTFDDMFVYKIGTLSREFTYIVYLIFFCVGLILVVLILHFYKSKCTQNLLRQPYVYVLSTRGKVRYLWVKRVRVSFFLKTKPEQLRMEGQQLIAMQAERMCLLVNRKFWFALLSENFTLSRSESEVLCVYIVMFVPRFAMGISFFIVGSVLNIVWGLVPLCGILLTYMSTLRRFYEIIFLLFISFYTTIFLQIVLKNNIMLAINLIIHLSGLDFGTGELNGITQLSIILAVFAYIIFYWSQFTKSYTEILGLSFKVSSDDLADDTVKSEFLTDRANKLREKKFLIKEFEFVCDKCSPVRKKVLRILLKLLLIGTFILLTVIIILLNDNTGNFGNITRVIIIVVVIVLPKAMERVFSEDSTSRLDDLEKRVTAAIKQWKIENDIEPGKDRKLFRRTAILQDVKCSLSSFCCGRVGNLKPYHGQETENNEIFFNENTKISLQSEK